MRRDLLLLATLAVFVAGCAKPEAPFVGSWRYASKLPATGDPRQDAALAKIFSNIVLELKPDRTWSLKSASETKSGTFTMRDKTVIMTLSNAKTEEDTRHGEAALSPDGKTLTIRAPDSHDRDAEFTRITG